MNKQILYEVYRQLELMGVEKETLKNKKILKENKFVAVGSDLLKTFFTTAKKQVPNLVDFVDVGTVRVSKDFYADMLRILDNPSTFNILDDAEKKLFGEVVAQNSQVVDNIYKKLMQDVVNNTGETEKVWIQTLVDQAARGKTVTEILNDLNGEEDIFLNEVLTQKILKKIRDFETGKFTPEVKKTVTSMKEAGGQSWEDIPPLSNDELLKLEKLYSQAGLGKSFKMAMQVFLNDVDGMMKKQYELMDETMSLIKTLNSSNVNSFSKVDIETQISNNIKKLTQMDAKNFSRINEWIGANIPKDARTLRLKIQGLKGYQKAAAIADNSALTKWKESYKGLFARRAALRKQLNSMLNPASWVGHNMDKWKKDGGNAYLNKWASFFKGDEFRELKNWMQTGQTQKWSGFNKFRQDFGFLPAIGNVTKEWVYAYIRLALTYTIVDYLSDLFGNIVRNYESFNKYKLIQDQIRSYDEHFDGVTSDSEYEPISGYSLFFRQLGLYTMEELKSMTTAFPGLYDELGVLLLRAQTKNITKEEAEKEEKRLQDLKAKLKAEMEEEAAKAKAAAERAKNAVDSARNNVVNPSTPTEQKFKDFIKTDWASDYTDTETFRKQGESYVVSDGVYDYYYTYNGTTFIEGPVKKIK
jgi:hypothetical protein